ncbi:MAG: dodecin domain-containing protein [Clostridia bacterium]|nr:dodecin domain-containing protein [Clostridia bacterium]
MVVEKHLKITGTSEVSWKDAIAQTISETSKTLDYITSITILEQRAKVSGKKITEYLVDLDLAFVVDRDRD